MGRAMPVEDLTRASIGLSDHLNQVGVELSICVHMDDKFNGTLALVDTVADGVQHDYSPLD